MTNKEYNREELVRYVISCIDELEKKFKSNPQYFLDFTEADPVAYLYHLIAQNPVFLEDIEYSFENGDVSTTKMLHAQGKTQDRIKVRPGCFDLVILDPEDEEGEFDCLMAIEVKRKENHSPTTQKRIEDDIDKLSNSGNDVQYKFLLILNFYERTPDEFRQKVQNYKSDPSLAIRFIEAEEV